MNPHHLPPAPNLDVGSPGAHNVARSEEFEAFYVRYYQLVWHMAWKLGADSGNVDDLVQETFVIALRRLPAVDANHAKFASRWLIQTLRNVIRNHNRGSARRVRRQREYSELIQRQREESTVTAHRLGRRLLEDFVKSLEPNQREVFMLAVLGGYSSREIGEALSIKPATVRTRLHAARAAFASAFSPDERAIVRVELDGACPKPPAVSDTRRRRSLSAVIAMGGGKIAVGGGALGGLALGGWISKVIALALATFGVTIAVLDLRVAERPMVPSSRDHESIPAKHEPPPQVTAAPTVSSVSLGAIEVQLPVTQHATTPARRDPSRAVALERARSVADAREALLEGRADLALELIRERDDWPSSSLATQAISLEIGALCALGRGDEARTRLGSWRASNPDLPLDPRVEGLCW